MTAEPYVPNEYTAKQMYVLQRQSMHNHISPDYGAEFDRFLSKIKADAWAEGYQDGRRQDSEGDDGPRFVNPYRIVEEA